MNNQKEKEGSERESELDYVKPFVTLKACSKVSNAHGEKQKKMPSYMYVKIQINYLKGFGT